MSNRLINLAKRVQSIGARRIHPSEKATLLALADDAREHLGGRTKDVITNRHIQEATGLSERAVRMAITALAEAGHITREAGQPGAPMLTVVHPGGRIADACEPIAAPAAIAPGGATIAGEGGNHCRGSYSNRDYTQDNPSPTAGRAREPAAADQDEGMLDPVGQVFAAWDGYHQRAGLGPVARGMARRAAVAARIADHGLGNALMIVDRTERAVKERRQPKGQGDLFFSFDMVFGVGSAAKIGIFERMLDGQFTPPEPKVAAPEPVARVDRSGEGEAGRLREAVRADVGDHSYQAWIEPCRFEFDGDVLVLTTPSAFKADWVQQHYADTLRRHAAKMTGGQIKRVIARAHAPA